MNIGITERGDPSIDFSWVEQMEKMDGVILITKNLTDAVIESKAQLEAGKISEHNLVER